MKGLHPVVCVDAGRHTCIRIEEASKYVRFIAMDAAGLTISKLSHEQFHADWTAIDYSPSKAAGKYLSTPEAQLSTTPSKVRDILEAILADSSLEDDSASSHSPSKENHMEGTAAATDTKPKASKAKSTAKASTKAPAKGTKAAPKEAAKGKAPAKDTKAASKPAAKPKGDIGRTTYAGKTITVLKKEHGAREGTKRAAAMDILIKAKNTDVALKEFAEYEGIDASFISFAVKTGIIKLS